MDLGLLVRCLVVASVYLLHVAPTAIIQAVQPDSCCACHAFLVYHPLRHRLWSAHQAEKHVGLQQSARMWFYFPTNGSQWLPVIAHRQPSWCGLFCQLQVLHCRIDPIAYVQTALALNEFLAPRWKNLIVGGSSASSQILEARSLPQKGQPTTFLHLPPALSSAAMCGACLLFLASGTTDGPCVWGVS